ncbi:MAG: hypothetical protein ACP5SH_21545 [Syntrophobacteraceae bacterium]
MGADGIFRGYGIDPLLRPHLMERPSIYEVVKFSKDREAGERLDSYLVQGLLSPDEVLRVRDELYSA